MGDYWTIGTLETADTETVYVTSVASSTATIQGMGSSENNTGFKYAHAILSAATEAQNVGAILLVGAKSVAKVYSSLTGEHGKISRSVPSLTVPNRFTDFSWWQLAGYGIVAQRYIMRGEFCTPADNIGFAEKLL